MHVGTAKVVLRLPENDNLKGKRRYVHSITSRLRSKFNVAVAEVDSNDQWQRLTLGITCVSNDPRHADSMLSNILAYLEEIADDLELLDCEVEVISL
jgi:uncharacterized protein YlxP (DUF503 family)